MDWPVTTEAEEQGESFSQSHSASLSLFTSLVCEFTQPSLWIWSVFFLTWCTSWHQTEQNDSTQPPLLAAASSTLLLSLTLCQFAVGIGSKGKLGAFQTLLVLYLLNYFIKKQPWLQNQITFPLLVRNVLQEKSAVIHKMSEIEKNNQVNQHQWLMMRQYRKYSDSVL